MGPEKRDLRPCGSASIRPSGRFHPLAAACGAAKRASEEALVAGADEDKIYTFGDAQQDLCRGAM